jgi:hypothetical protein
MKDFINNLSQSTKEMAKVVISLIVIILLSFLVGKFGISNLVDIRNQISDTQKEVTVLTEKLSVLQSLSKTTVESVASVTEALPGSSPALTAISQLENIAAENNVTLTGIKTGAASADISEVVSISTTFQAIGTRDGILAFLKDVETFAPISQVDKVSLSENGGIISANISTKTYWAPFPSTIPTVTQPITDLSVSEKATLIKANALIQPVFSTLAPSEGGVNTAPFGQ